MRRMLLTATILAGAALTATHAQTVEFQGLPSVAEVLGILAPEAPPPPMSRSAVPPPPTPRTIRDAATNADLTAGGPSAPMAAAPAPAPATPRPARPAQPSRASISQQAGFAPGSAALPNDVKQMLMVIAGALQQAPGLSIIVSGHTDASGGPGVNDPLSQRRADAALAFLIGIGISSDRVVSVGQGARLPLPGLDATDPRHRRIEYWRLPSPTEAMAANPSFARIARTDPTAAIQLLAAAEAMMRQPPTITPRMGGGFQGPDQWLLDENPLLRQLFIHDPAAALGLLERVKAAGGGKR